PVGGVTYHASSSALVTGSPCLRNSSSCDCQRERSVCRYATYSPQISSVTAIAVNILRNPSSFMAASVSASLWRWRQASSCDSPVSARAEQGTAEPVALVLAPADLRQPVGASASMR